MNPPPPAETTEAAKHITLGERVIGDGCATYVIAEAGVNHDGAPERALQLVDAAAECGADAVKFQWFSAATLVSRSAPLAAYQRSSHAPAAPGGQQALLRQLELDGETFAVITSHCRARGIEFLATPFSVASLQAYTAVARGAIKIASTDIVHRPLLEQAAAARLPLLISTGASTLAEMDTAVGWLRAWGALGRTVLMHCVSCYPTPIARANIGAVRTLRDRFGVLAGYSDHTTSLSSGGWAVACGASVIEKHLTLDRHGHGPDHAMSLDPSELRTYVNRVRQAERALGDACLGMCEAETDVRKVARRSIVAARDLPAGALLTPDMLSIKRPGGGIEPAALDDLVGRTLTAPVPADAPLSWRVVL